MSIDMVAKKSSKDTAPMKLFYIFYNQERWDNWIQSLQSANFEQDPDSEDAPEGLRMVYNFTEDITISVLKIIRLHQNERFSKEEALAKIDDVERIVMSSPPPEDLEDIVGSVQLSLAVLFASCRKYLEGEYEADIKALVKKGRSIDEENLEEALDVAANIGASVINGVACCSKFIKDDAEDPSLFDEWLIEIETMANAVKSLAKFDEEPGEVT